MPLAVINAVVQLPDGVDMLEDDDVPWIRMLLVHVEHDVNRAGLLEFEGSGCHHP